MKKIWITAIVSVLSIALVIGLYYAYSIYDFANEIYEPSESDSNNSVTILSNEENEESLDEVILDWGGNDRINILFIGVDAREASNTPLTDTLILASISPVNKDVMLFSILRDTYVEIEKEIWGRINEANPHGGVELTMEVVSDLTGLDVSHYFYTDFEGFVQLIDTIGGIEIDVEKDMQWIDTADDPKYNIDLKKGLQKLTGMEALQYVRFRFDAQSDYGRTERQRKFLTILANELKSTMSIVKLPEILGNLAIHLKTNVTPSELWQLARFGLQTEFNHIDSIQIPPPGLFEPRKINRKEVLVVEKLEIRNYVDEQLLER